MTLQDLGASQGLYQQLAATGAAALADDGELYSSVQSAVDAASGFVLVAPGTYSEAVTISTAGLSLIGSGYGTLIDGGTTGHAITLDAANISVQNLSVQTTAGSGNSYHGIGCTGNGTNATINTVWVRDSDDRGIMAYDGSNYRPDWTITNVTVENADGSGIQSGTRNIVTGCHVQQTRSEKGIAVGYDDAIVTNNVVKNSGAEGIMVYSNDGIVGGNRIQGAGDRGLVVYTSGTAENIVFNNRIADSTNSDLTDNGTSTTLDANVTGASN